MADGACMAAPFVADVHKYPSVLLVLCDWYYAIVRIGKPILKVEWIYVLAPPAVYKKGGTACVPPWYVKWVCDGSLEVEVAFAFAYFAEVALDALFEFFLRIEMP